MQIYVRASLLTLAIYFNFIELSLQYNTTALKEGDRILPTFLNIHYSLTGKPRVLVTVENNPPVHGFIDPVDNAIVGLIEQVGSIRLARALMIGSEKIRVYNNGYGPLSNSDILRYQLHFDHDVNS
ncbi:uncharacterized protein LOC117173499 [Belonocnema kinseyi]|uniref:uncharacterized protein LOC117173499 n=1 Tax=Belonocnema kinseyi TaxID=2817044 RepID=UPI00143D4CF0|nr:uncharacterized protein LOC117173499 [Belonocnema kinseyi]